MEVQPANASSLLPLECRVRPGTYIVGSSLHLRKWFTLGDFNFSQ